MYAFKENIQPETFTENEINTINRAFSDSFYVLNIINWNFAFSQAIEHDSTITFYYENED